MKTICSRTIRSPLAWLALAMLSASGTLPAQVIPGRYIAVLKAETRDTPGAAKALAARHNLDVDHVYTKALKGFAFNGSEQAAAALVRRAEIAYVEPDQIYTAFQQTVPTGIRRCDADAVPGLIGSGFMVDADVAVIDTGLDGSHPDLNVMPGGIRFSSLNASKVRSDANWQDDNGHGTHVGGTIGAKDNDIGVVGVAPGARLTAVKVLDSAGGGSLSTILAGVDWVVQRAATFEVANMSLGGGFSQAMNDAVKAGTQAGIVFVVAAGNSLTDAANFSPASEPTALTVSALADTDGLPAGLGPLTQERDMEEALAWFSNYGGLIDICAPGIEIHSTYLTSKGGYASLSGTSMASPHVAGAAALYIARHGMTKTGAGVEAVCAAIRNSGWQPGSYAHFYDFIYGETRFDDFAEPLLNVADLLYWNDPATVCFVSPMADTKVIGVVALQATTTASSATAVQFYLDGLMIGAGTENSGIWTFDWDTTLSSDGLGTLVAVATDGTTQLAGDALLLGVNNGGTVPPSVRILEPYYDTYLGEASTVVSGVTGITASVLNLGPVDTVKFYYENNLLGDGEFNGTDWVFAWDTTQAADGLAILTAVATGADGMQGTSIQVQVIVDNAVVQPSVHIGELSWSRQPDGSGWRATVGMDVHNTAHFLVPGVTVHATWNGGGETTSMVSNDQGRCVFTRTFSKKTASVTFTVTHLTPPLEWPGVTYDSSMNHGSTSVTIYKP